MRRFLSVSLLFLALSWPLAASGQPPPAAQWQVILAPDPFDWPVKVGLESRDRSGVGPRTLPARRSR
jgi:hypothetical protein